MTSTAPAHEAAAAPDAIAATLARFVHRLARPDIPADVAERARHLMLDAIGCGLAARRDDFAIAFARATAALSGSSPGSRGVIGMALRLPPRDAAMLNGVITHGLDYDDTHMAGVLHLSVSVLPALLALGGELDASGEAVLLAYVAGLEAGARIASVARSGFHAHGFHPTGVVGAFASALAAGKLMGLDEAGLLRAQGIALSLASGSLQFIEDGSWTKRLHPGWAAQAGIVAATMAREGIPAPVAPYEGRYGLYRIHLGQVEHAGIDLSLGTAGIDPGGRASTWETMNVAIKPFPICHFNHACTDAAIALHRQGVEWRRVSTIEALVPQGVVQAVCEPVANKRRPTSDYDAKFSLPYGVASGLMRGRLGLKELETDAFTAPDAQALMERVRYRVDEASTFPRHYSGEVRVTLDDGRTIAHREAINRGHAERPLSNADVFAKYQENATLRFPASHAAAVAEHVLGLDRLASVRVLEDLLATDADVFVASATEGRR